MKKIKILLLLAISSLNSIAQAIITNGNFESWGNTTPGLASEPTNWYSNQSGSSIASLGPQTCFKDITVFHGGTASVRVESKTYLGSVVNGNVTTGVVNAPTITKADGYIGTVNYTTTTDIRRMSFTGRPDSLVGWYQYSQGGGTEQGKIRAILHTGDYFDPETPTTYHTNPTANKIGDATFLTPFSNVTTWTRFSVPFSYVSGSVPTYIMINVTSSADQLTTIAGSKLWLDDLQAIYSTTAIIPAQFTERDVNIYSYGKSVCVNYSNNHQDEAILSVFDLSGKLVFSAKMACKDDHIFDLGNVVTGIYLYRLDNTGFCKKGRIFIQ